MIQNRKPVSASGLILLFIVLLNVVVLKSSYTGNEQWYWLLVISLPLLLLAILNVRQKKYTRRSLEDIHFKRGIKRKKSQSLLN